MIVTPTPQTCSRPQKKLVHPVGLSNARRQVFLRPCKLFVTPHSLNFYTHSLWYHIHCSDPPRRRCPHVRTDLSDIGSAHEYNAKTMCVKCHKNVRPCVKCLCYITMNNFRKHRENCKGSRYEMLLSGPVGSRQRVAGKFSKKVKRKQRMPGRERKELFAAGKFLLANSEIGKVCIQTNS